MAYQKSHPEDVNNLNESPINSETKAGGKDSGLQIKPKVRGIHPELYQTFQKELPPVLLLLLSKGGRRDATKLLHETSAILLAPEEDTHKKRKFVEQLRE